MKAHTWSRDRVWGDVAVGCVGKGLLRTDKFPCSSCLLVFFFSFSFFFSFPFLLTLLCSLEEKHSFPPLGLFLFFFLQAIVYLYVQACDIQLRHSPLRVKVLLFFCCVFFLLFVGAWPIQLLPFFSLCAKGWDIPLGCWLFPVPRMPPFPPSPSPHQQNRSWRTKGEGARSTPLSLRLSIYHFHLLTFSLSFYLSYVPHCCVAFML